MSGFSQYPVVGAVPRGAERAFSRIDPASYARLQSMEPSVQGALRYWPCSATLANARIVPRVLFCEAKPFLKTWGIHPQDLHRLGFDLLDARDIAAVVEYENRLPACEVHKV